MKLKKDKSSKKGRLIKTLLLQIIFFALLLLFFSVLWISNTYDNIGLDEVVFHLKVPLNGTSKNYVSSYILTALCPSVLICAAGWFLLRLTEKHFYDLTLNVKLRQGGASLCTIEFFDMFVVSVYIVFAAVLFYIADKKLDIAGYYKSQVSRSSFIENEYISPLDVKISFPDKKRNLIWIFMESTETSIQDKANGGFFDVNIIPELTQIAKDNVSFSQSDLIEGAAVAPSSGWTIAALVAETSGLPLKIPVGSNAMSQYSSFMPGVISLGEILEAENYHNYFMAGSDFVFGGRLNYFTQHGNYEIFDYYSAIEEGKISEHGFEWKSWWGFEDAKLYSYAKEKLLKLASEEKPFNFSLLTVDTHQPNGYLCELCPDTYDDQYSNVWACASSQVDEFVKWIQQQDFYENTTIVICGDHCSMDKNYYGDLTYGTRRGETTRKVYNAIINSAIQPIQQKNRRFTTLDLFPTALASMGVEIEGNRLGLGTNLFSKEKTLSEKYGYDELFAELKKKSVFYDEEILYPS